jgi:cellulose synthase (UDP-forming)
VTELAPFALSLAVVGFFLAIAPGLPRNKTWARTLVVAVGLAVCLRYLVWRLVATVCPADLVSVEGAWILFLFGFELLAFGNQFILHSILTRVTDRTPEADRYEAELRRTPVEQLPSVDVFICTYNEGLDVVERTIVAALAIDYPKFTVWVLDDGKRDWLKDFCAAKGARYLRRPDNRHAKAGNINHALSVTHGDLFAVLDADFAPMRGFLYRTVGFFRDRRVGIVQTPQHFFNPDPTQLNLGLTREWPDDQRLFFDVILPARDAWDVAWCCGSCSVQRRSAILSVGGVPTDSITEDLLSTLVLLRRGYVTRYLNERLSMGLCPENLDGFFKQRERWCRGNLQTLFLKAGPLGPGLSLRQRLLFLSLDWVVHYTIRLLTILVPIVFLWTGVGPFVIPSLLELMSYQLPVLLALLGVTRWFALNGFLPILSSAATLFGSFRIVPAGLATLIKPFGTPFKVTPKGNANTFSFGDPAVLVGSFVLIALTVGGLIKNRIAPAGPGHEEAVMMVAEVWALVNVVLLAVAALIAIEKPRPRKEERFPVDEPAEYRLEGAPSCCPCHVVNISVSGAFLALAGPVPVGARLELALPGVGTLPACAVRGTADGVGICFEPLPEPSRDGLIHYIYSWGRTNAVETVRAGAVFRGLLRAFVKG